MYTLVLKTRKDILLHPLTMKDLFSILVRAVFTFTAFCVIQYTIPWYFLTLGGLAAGFFLLKTGEDRALAIGILGGSIAFGIFAFAMAQIYPVTG
jgi:hypothetical protein